MRSTWVLFASMLYNAESACMCPNSNPGCESDGNCYWRTFGHSWSWKGLDCGKCTSSYASSSTKLKNAKLGSIKRCYASMGITGSWCYLKKKDGSFASSGCSSYNGYGTEWCCPGKYRCHAASSPSPAPAPKTNKLKDSGRGNTGKCYSYYGHSKKREWCYTKKSDGSFATSKCSSYDGHTTKWCCPGKTKCSASGGSSGGCHPGALGKFIANFVKSKKGTKVYSKKQGSASCWDLAWGAMEKAKEKGYNPVFYQDATSWLNGAYVWSDEEVPIDQAQPGDIAQFKGWEETYNGYSKVAWNPHTAVVTGCYKDGALPTGEQNPSPVSFGKYHPHQKTSGSVKIYRLKSKTLRMYSETPQLNVLNPSNSNVLAAACVITGLAAFAFIVKRRRSVAFGALSTEEDQVLLNTEAPSSTSAEVTTE